MEFSFSVAGNSTNVPKSSRLFPEKPCGIYEIKSQNGRISYKIFAENEDLHCYLKKNKSKVCETRKPVFSIGEYKEYPHTQVRKLTAEDIQTYLSER